MQDSLESQIAQHEEKAADFLHKIDVTNHKVAQIIDQFNSWRQKLLTANLAFSEQQMINKNLEKTVSEYQRHNLELEESLALQVADFESLAVLQENSKSQLEEAQFHLEQKELELNGL